MTAPSNCFKHSNRETRLSCAACERPICVSCSRQTAVATKCFECLDKQTPDIFKIAPQNWLIFGIIMVVIGGCVGILMAYVFDSLVSIRAPFQIPYFVLTALLALSAFYHSLIVRAYKRRKIIPQRRYMAAAMVVISYISLILWASFWPFFNFDLRHFIGFHFGTIYLIMGVAIGVYLALTRTR